MSMTDPASGEVTETYQIPRMDLSDRPITVTYDNMTQPWPASYVSIFYPEALEMEMDAAQVEGQIPPNWGIPSNARGSALIEKLNIASVNDPNEFAWPLGVEFAANPETGAVIKGGVRTDHATAHGMTREELVKLIRAIDLGGQFYARQNTAFVPFANDPVGGTEL